jgi:hypothetical protein
MEVINFFDHFKEQISSDYQRLDDFGRQLNLYFCSYKFEDKNYSLDIWAYDMEDAERRVEAIRDSFNLEGQLLLEV